MKTTRVPITAASRMGVSKLASKGAEGRVVLTSHGRAVAVIDSAERFDEDARLIRESAAALLDAAADIVSANGRVWGLDETCSRLGVDVDKVRAKADQKRAG